MQCAILMPAVLCYQLRCRSCDAEVAKIFRATHTANCALFRPRQHHLGWAAHGITILGRLSRFLPALKDELRFPVAFSGARFHIVHGRAGQIEEAKLQSDCLAFSRCADCVAFWDPGPATDFGPTVPRNWRAPTPKPADQFGPGGPDKMMGAVQKTSQGTTANVYFKPQYHLQCVRVSVGLRQFSTLRKRVT